jgi:hypothetical protein
MKTIKIYYVSITLMFVMLKSELLTYQRGIVVTVVGTRVWCYVCSYKVYLHTYRVRVCDSQGEENVIQLTR